MDLGIVSMQMYPLTAVSLKKWSVIGTWPCPKEGGWDTVNPPEKEIRLDEYKDWGNYGAQFALNIEGMYNHIKLHRRGN